ncbi:site-specific integrase [Plantactinospora veratri]|uniref:Site-specific integrase n=1 Tax=Plantactinospora veratri TaxID=1436122 RepID=A0ABU7SN87_9ACTN
MARARVVKERTNIPGVRKATRTYPDGRKIVRWEVQIKDALGKLRHVGTYDDKEEARRARNEARASVDAGTFVARSAGAVTFLSVAEAWLRTPAVRRLKESTRYGYERIMRHSLEPFHAVPVGRLGYEECSTLIGDAMATHAASTVGHILHVLRKVFDHAVKSGYIRANPAREVAKPKKGSKRVEIVLQPVDIARILASIPDARGDRPDRWRLLVELAVESGCRAGELAGLRVHRLNPDRRLLVVEETSQEVNGKVVLGTPKTKAGFRTVDNLSADLCRRLAAHVAGMAPDDFVFGDGDQPYRHNNFNNRVFKPVVKALGLEYARFHDVRHFHASAMLLLVGEGRVGEVARRLGHSKPSMTLDVYGHVLEHQSRDVSAAFAALLAEGRKRATTPPPTPVRPAESATEAGVVDLGAERRRRRAG